MQTVIASVAQGNIMNIYKEQISDALNFHLASWRSMLYLLKWKTGTIQDLEPNLGLIQFKSEHISLNWTSSVNTISSIHQPIYLH